MTEQNFLAMLSNSAERIYWDLIYMGTIFVILSILGLYGAWFGLSQEPPLRKSSWSLIVSSFVFMVGGFMIIFIGLKM